MATPPLPWAASQRENSVERSLLRSNIKFPSAFLPVIPCPAEIRTSRIQIPRHECSASLQMLTRHCTQDEGIAQGILLHLQCPTTKLISGLGLLQGILALGVSLQPPPALPFPQDSIGKVQIVADQGCVQDKAFAEKQGMMIGCSLQEEWPLMQPLLK